MAAILLSAAVLAEIAEYDRIVAFAEQVLAGTHPRVKIPQHLIRAPKASARHALLLPARIDTSAVAPPTCAPPTTSNLSPSINPAHDFYRDLGVQVHVSQDSIERAYKAKLILYSPNAPQAHVRYQSADPEVVRSVEEGYQRIETAYAIVGDPVQRKEYDEARAAVEDMSGEGEDGDGWMER